MKWGFGTELKNYQINSGTSFEIKDFNSKETVPFVDMSKGLKLDISIDGKIIDKNGESNTKINIEGLVGANIIIDVKTIDRNIYIKPSFDIKDEMINSFLSKLEIKEDEWIFISIDNPGEIISSFNINETLLKTKDFDKKAEELLLKSIEEKLINIESTGNTKDSIDGELVEIQFSVKEGKLLDFILIVGEIYDKTKEEVLEGYNNEDMSEHKSVLENLIYKLKLSTFINKETKYVQGIGFILSDLDITTPGFSLLSSFSTSTLLETINEFNIDVPENTATVEEIFTERPKVKKVKESLENSLITLKSCMDKDMEINAPEINKIICEDSIENWFTLPRGYSYSNYYNFNIDEDDNYSWEYCVHNEELDDIQCKEEGCKSIDCYKNIIDSCETVEECKIVLDVDNDGFTIEEEAQYGTDPNNPDTDGDGYLDGEEVENGYNPSGEGLLELNDNNIVTEEN